MSCKTYDPCLNGKLNQIGSYASVARQSAEASQASATSAATNAASAAASAAAAAASAAIAGVYLGAFAVAPVPPIEEGALYFNTVSNLLFVWNGTSWSAIQTDDIYLGGFAVAPTLNNQGLPLMVGNLYWNTVSNNLWAWNGSAWVATNFNEFTPFLATGTTTARDLQERMADVVNVKDFGAVGDGITDDRESIKKAIEYINTVGGTLFFPNGVYYSPYLSHINPNNWIEITRSDIEFVGEGLATIQNILLYFHGQYGTQQIVGASGFTIGDNQINTASSHDLAVNDYVQLISGVNSYSKDAGDWQLGSRNPTTNNLSEVRFGEIHQIAKIDSSTTATLKTSVIYPNYKNNTIGQNDPMTGVIGATIRKLTPIKNITIKNISFVSGSTNFRNILIRCAANFTFDNCQFETITGLPGAHIKTSDVYNLYFYNCKSIRYPDYDNGSGWNSFIIGGGCQNISFDNCNFIKGQQHIDFTNLRSVNDIGYDNVGSITTQNIFVTNSTFINCSDGFTTHPGTFNLTATGNTFQSCNTAIRVRNRRSVIASNNITAIRVGLSFSAFYEDTLIANNNITQSITQDDLQWVGINFNTLSSEIMNNNDFQNVVVSGNTIKNLGTNLFSDGILFNRGTASNPSFTLDTDAEKRKTSNIVVCDNRIFGCSIRVAAFTNRVNILRNMFDGTTNRTHFISCELNSGRHKIAENFFNSVTQGAVLVSDTPNPVFSTISTTHRVGSILSELPSSSTLDNTEFFYRKTNRTELTDDIIFSNGNGPIAIRNSGIASLYIDALPKDGISDSIVRIFNESSTSTTGTKTLQVKGNVQIDGSIAKGSGSFKIKHPLPQLSQTNYLVHSFIEAPNADLFYSGEIQLINGIASINIDQVSGMTEGTFEMLCRSVRRFVSNETGWSSVKSKISGNLLEIECQDKTSNDTIFWMVIGERKDKHIIEANWTNENGKVIVEPPIESDIESD